LRIARVELTQRYGGQTDAGSWTARILARIGGAVVLAALALSCVGLSAAQAASHRHAGDPSPQAAPGSSASTPAPDPAPQAATRSTPVSASRPSIRQTTSSRSTWHPSTAASSPVVPPRAGSVPAASSGVVAHAASGPTHPASHHVARHVAARPTSTRVAPLSFPLALPRDLLLLPRAALRAGDPGRGNGVLLLLSAVAMGVVAVASFTLLRRLRGLAA
jgi:hypothetical protein